MSNDEIIESFPTLDVFEQRLELAGLDAVKQAAHPQAVGASQEEKACFSALKKLTSTCEAPHLFSP